MEIHPRDVAQQRSSFDAALDDPIVMFVSHIQRYCSSAEPADSAVELIHSAYSKTAFGPYAGALLTDSDQTDWTALDKMEELVIKDVRTARADGRPYTHLLFASMGWNNDQFEAIARCNAVVQHSRRAALAQGAALDPLVIGLTWPSVWGGTSVVDLANRASHLGSYPTRARYADEIGYGIANHHLNAKRSLPEYKLVPPVRWILSGEGGPHQNHAGPNGRMAMAWSAKDTANPVARFATGALHVGGKAVAHRIYSEAGFVDIFEKAKITSRDAIASLDGPCRSSQQSDEVLYLEATGIIAAHGDIANPAVD
ncbi:hypothetical protein [Sulfitobacter sp.]|uniref:hypothetical protein n=1 Tax=Sulfitobacter sp. TaxID=1903071 RepID=UPI003002B82E